LPREIEAALFVYSTQPLATIPKGLQAAQVDQIDLPPTLAMLMDVPIPFGSLGWLIPEVMPAQGSPAAHVARLLQMARSNAWQVGTQVSCIMPPVVTCSC
jgi:phosphatidylinositol glycan class O